MFICFENKYTIGINSGQVYFFVEIDMYNSFQMVSEFVSSESLLLQSGEGLYFLLQKNLY